MANPIEIVLERMQPSLSGEGCQHTEKNPHSHIVHERLPGICADPVHLHSFAKEFSLTSFIRMRKCIGCQNRFVTHSSGPAQPSSKSIRNLLDYASGKDGELLRCVACGIHAHRSCAFSKQRILDTCKIHQLAFERRMQYHTTTYASDRLCTHEPNTDCDVTSDFTDLTDELKEDDPSRIIPDESMKANIPTKLNEIKDDNTSNITWSHDGPPAHWAHTTPASLWGIKCKPRFMPEIRLSEMEIGKDGACANGDHSIILGGEANAIVNEELPLGQSFMNASKVLQDTLFRYFSRSQLEMDKDASIAHGVVCNDTPEDDHGGLVKEGDNQQEYTPNGLSHASIHIGSTPSDSEIPFNLLSPTKPLKTMEKSTSFLENTLKGVRIDALAKRGVQLASAAGNFAGGLAGLFLAGPTGMYVGSRIGTVACVASVVGIILEGPIGVGILVVGVAGTLLSVKNAKADEKRLLTLGSDEGKLLMVRSNIVIDPIWEEILASARKSTPSIVKLPGLTTNAEKRRRLRDFNIISSDESELTFSNKVFLLVSSSLNDKKSHAGHIYRYLMREYRKRALKHMQDRTRIPLLNQENTDDILRATRQDTHAVIKYVTMVLLEARPGLDSSPRTAEMTASTVESLVFGEVYDLVLREILDETRDIDNNLMLKISDFQVCAKTDFNDYVSERALYSLRLLPDAHSVGEKLNHIVRFLEEISHRFSIDQNCHRAICADNLLEMVCQHLIVAKVPNLNAEICFLQEFAHDDQLLRGKEGYALVTLQASLHFMNICPNFDTLFVGLGHVHVS